MWGGDGDEVLFSVKKFVKVGLSEGGGVQLDFLLKRGCGGCVWGGGGGVMNVIEKYLC